MKIIKLLIICMFFTSCSKTDKISGWYPGTFYLQNGNAQQNDTISENLSTSNFEATVRIEPLTVFDVKMTLYINNEIYTADLVEVNGEWPGMTFGYHAAWNNETYQILWLQGTVNEGVNNSIDLQFNYTSRSGNNVGGGHFQNYF